MKRLIVTAMIPVFFLLLVSVPVVSATDGTLIINANRTLTEDHHGNIVIAASNVTLACNGHTVMGDGAGTGIEIIGRARVTVTRCFVTNFLTGFALTSVVGSVISRNRVQGNQGPGFEVRTSSTNIFSENVAFDNKGEGFRLRDSSSNHFIRNTTQMNHDGFDLDRCSENFLERNTVIRNTVNGIELDANSNNNVIYGNTASSNGQSGISLDDSSNNSVEFNDAFKNGKSGFRFQRGDLGIGSNGNFVIHNHAAGNLGNDGCQEHSDNLFHINNFEIVQCP